MNVALIVILASVLLGAQQSQVNVRELPPEEIPTGSCSKSATGYLGIVEKDKTERTNLTDQEIGEYVRKKLAEGYSVTLYPQASGKMFTVQTCHPAKP